MNEEKKPKKPLEPIPIPEEDLTIMERLPSPEEARKLAKKFEMVHLTPTPALSVLVADLSKSIRELSETVREAFRPVPGIRPPVFKVPPEHEREFFAWLGAEGVKNFRLSDAEQQERLFSNWKLLIKEKRKVRT